MRVKVTGLEAQVRQLRKAASRMRNQKPAFRAIGQKFVRSTHECFTNQRSPEGTAWEPLSPAYRKRKETRGRSPLILIYGGRLRASISFKAGRSSVTWGTNIKYGRWHQEGTKFMPAREFLGYTTTQLEEAKAMIRRYIETGRVK